MLTGAPQARARVLVFGVVLLFGGCLYSEYGVVADGGRAGTTGTGAGGVGGRGGGAGSVAGAGRGGATTGAAGTGAAGTTGVAGTSGVAGSTGASGGSGGTAGTGGTGGTTGLGGAAGGTAGTGRGGTTGAAGTGGSVAGRGGTTGVAGTGGSVAGRGGTTGVAGTGGAIAGVAGTGGGTAGRGGTTGLAGTGGGTAGRGGTTGSGGSTAGAGGSTPAPDWVPSFSVVYQFDLGQGQLGVEAHGGTHLEEQGPFFPLSDDTTAIEGKSAQLRYNAANPGYFVQPGGTALPAILQTPPGTSFTLGGWFRISSGQSGDLQYLISDDGPGAYMGGFVFYLDQRLGSFGSSGAAAYCRIGFSGSTTDFNYNEAETPTEVGPDSIAGNRWAHLVCRYDANNGTLSVFNGGSLAAQEAATKPIRSGPGPFMLGCDQTYCGLTGNMDEVFFTRSALDDAHVNRIYACGIDGNRCRCSGSGYVSCGYAAPSGCVNLPTCDVAQ
jgi:hypothetical protein